MPKCNCAGNACSCLIVGGSGVDVQGQGTVAAPYVISVAATPASVEVGTNSPLDLTVYGTSAILRVALSANVTDIELLGDGARFDLVFQQGGAGGHTVTFPAEILWAGGTAPTITATAGALDWVQLIQADGIWLGTRVGADLS